MKYIGKSLLQYCVAVRKQMGLPESHLSRILNDVYARIHGYTLFFQ
jgi:hypothetical protein